MLKNINIIFFFIFIYTELPAQGGLPISVLNIDFNFFDKEYLHKYSIDSIWCIKTFLYIENNGQFDTLEFHSATIDSNGNITLLNQVYFDEKLHIISDFQISDFRRKERVYFLNLVKKGEFKYTKSDYCNNKLVSKRFYRFVDTNPDTLLIRQDSFIYTDTLLSKIVETWYDEIDNTKTDSIIHLYKYNYDNKISEYVKKPSKTFFRNIHLQYPVYEELLHTSNKHFKYEYDKDGKTIVTKYVIINNEYQGAEFDTISSYKTLLLTQDIEVDQDENESNKFFHLKFNEGKKFYEYKDEEFKKIEYYNDTPLPELILVLSDQILYLYKFIYFK